MNQFCEDLGRTIFATTVILKLTQIERICVGYCLVWTIAVPFSTPYFPFNEFHMNLRRNNPNTRVITLLHLWIYYGFIGTLISFHSREYYRIISLQSTILTHFCVYGSVMNLWSKSNPLYIYIYIQSTNKGNSISKSLALVLFFCRALTFKDWNWITAPLRANSK